MPCFRPAPPPPTCKFTSPAPTKTIQVSSTLDCISSPMAPHSSSAKNTSSTTTPILPSLISTPTVISNSKRRRRLQYSGLRARSREEWPPPTAPSIAARITTPSPTHFVPAKAPSASSTRSLILPIRPRSNCRRCSRQKCAFLVSAVRRRFPRPAFSPQASEQGMTVYSRDDVAAGTTIEVSVSGTAPPPSNGDQQGRPDSAGRLEPPRRLQAQPSPLLRRAWIRSNGCFSADLLPSSCLARVFSSASPCPSRHLPNRKVRRRQFVAPHRSLRLPRRRLPLRRSAPWTAKWGRAWTN